MKTTEEVKIAVLRFVNTVTSGKLEGAQNIALATVNLLERIVSEFQHDIVAQLLCVVRDAGRLLSSELPERSVCANLVRRVLHIIRYEYHALSECDGASLQQLVRAAAARRSVHAETLLVRTPVLDHIAEYKAELEGSVENVSSQAPEHIHADEVVLVAGASSLVESFLRSAARQRTFHVVLAPGPDRQKSLTMRASLQRAKIDVTMIENCAVMAVMSRVNKVIMSTESVLASGGLRAAAGAHGVALAAKYYSVPVIVVCVLYQLCPLHRCSSQQDEFNILLSGDSALPYETGDVVSKTHVYAPMFDYVPPDLVTLLVTNLGGYSPSYVYRMMRELYDPTDYDL